MLKVVPAQVNPIVGDLGGNLRLIRKIWEDCPEDTDLVVFPEMVTCGYPPEDLVLKPFFIEQIGQHVEKLVKTTTGSRKAILLPTPWKSEGRVYNAALLIEGGRIRNIVTKHYLPNYGVFDELRVFASGPLPLPVEFRGCKLGIMICEDMWYPEPAASLRENGADLLLVTNSSPYEGTKSITRLDVARARTRETALPLLYINQVGGQDELVFDGASFAIDASGDIVLSLKEFEEETGQWSLVRQEEGSWTFGPGKIIPNLPNTEAIYRALVLGLGDYVRKNGFPGVLIGLSGGIDSALCATIACDALGADKVRCVMMPSAYTSEASMADAAKLASAFDFRLETIPIDNVVRAFGDELGPHLGETVPEITYENLQSRCRGMMLMALSNSSGYMVVSTGNKSEMATGYATLYGDMCGGFNPLKDIYKTQVYELANWRNRQGAVIPERVITRAPSAELKPGQTDQDSLPPYDVLDDILSCLIEKDMDIKSIAARGHSEDLVRTVWRLLDIAEYKRRQAPPGIKITSRAFGRDRRYPITNHFVNNNISRPL